MSDIIEEMAKAAYEAGHEGAWAVLPEHIRKGLTHGMAHAVEIPRARGHYDLSGLYAIKHSPHAIKHGPDWKPAIDDPLGR